MAMDGLSEVIGSWNTMPMRAPRRSRNSLGESLVTSLPSNWIAPAVRWMAGGSSPMIARAASVFPEPDSPTMPTISPGATEKLMVLTTSSLVRATSSCRPSTLRSSVAAMSDSAHAWIEPVAHRIAKQVDAEQRQGDAQAGEDAEPDGLAR